MAETISLEKRFFICYVSPWYSNHRNTCCYIKFRFMKAPKATPLFKVFWCVGDTVREEIKKDNPVPIAVAVYTARKLKSSTHRMGNLYVVSSDTDPKTYKPPLTRAL